MIWGRVKGGPRVSWLRSHRNDLILAAVLLLLGGALALVLWLARQPGAYARVTVGGEVVAEVPLDRDTNLAVQKGYFVEAYGNYLIVRDGAIWMESADCPDQLCVHQGAIRYVGESIVCLPNKVVVTVVNGQDGGFDAVVR